MVSLNFPPSFTFGIAESDLQTVGSLVPQKEEGALQTMWEKFASQRGIDIPDYGAWKYVNAEHDISYIKNLGVKAYRTSISMSRTIDKHGKKNTKALAWYRDYFERIKSAGIEIHACLYHWEAPYHFAEKGILDPEFPSYFEKHVQIVLDELSDLIDYIIPINELWCITYLSYYRGIHAPGYQDIQMFFHSYFAAVRLQANAIRQIASHASRKKIGIVNIHFPAYIQEEYIDNPKHRRARDIADFVTNHLYSDPFFTGRIDEDMARVFRSYLPHDWKDIINDAKVNDLINYYGVNYYNSMYVEPSDAPIQYAVADVDGQLVNSLGWPVSLPPHYPYGLTDMLVSYSHRYAFHGLKTIIVSENGTPAYTPVYHGTSPSDDIRIFFIHEHLKQVQQAIQKGAPVVGYFLWTLLDNYEWQEGYKSESSFGIIAVDRKTGARIPKKSYRWYQKVIQSVYEHR